MAPNVGLLRVNNSHERESQRWCVDFKAKNWVKNVNLMTQPGHRRLVTVIGKMSNKTFTAGFFIRQVTIGIVWHATVNVLNIHRMFESLTNRTLGQL